MFTPLFPNVYSKTGVYRGIQFFIFLIKNKDCGYSLEPHPRYIKYGFFSGERFSEDFIGFPPKV